jgi:hypothetical protein
MGAAQAAPHFSPLHFPNGCTLAAPSYRAPKEFFDRAQDLLRFRAVAVSAMSRRELKTIQNGVDPNGSRRKEE